MRKKKLRKDNTIYEPHTRNSPFIQKNNSKSSNRYELSFTYIFHLTLLEIFFPETKQHNAQYFDLKIHNKVISSNEICISINFEQIL